MDISGVSIPAVPEAQVQPPQNAEVQSAVRESAESASSNNNDSGSGEGQARRDTSSSLGNNVDERV